jgi:hypothetical protein
MACYERYWYAAKKAPQSKECPPDVAKEILLILDEHLKYEKPPEPPQAALKDYMDVRDAEEIENASRTGWGALIEKSKKQLQDARYDRAKRKDERRGRDSYFGGRDLVGKCGDDDPAYGTPSARRRIG